MRQQKKSCGNLKRPAAAEREMWHKQQMQLPRQSMEYMAEENAIKSIHGDIM